MLIIIRFDNRQRIKNVKKINYNLKLTTISKLLMKRKYNQSKKPQKIIKVLNEQGVIQQTDNKQKDSQNTQQLIDSQQGYLPDEQEFEDQFDDEFQPEEAWISQSDDDEEQIIMKQHDLDQKMTKEQTLNVNSLSIRKKEKINNRMKQHEIDEQPILDKKQIFLGSNKQLQKGQILQFDNSAYDMLHRLNIEWPSLSIDFIYKSSPFESFSGFESMQKYPYEVYTVQGSCNNTKNNFIYLNKWTKLYRTRYDDDPHHEGQEQQNLDQDPVLFYQQAITTYDINRIRSLNGSPVVAFWNDGCFKGGQIHLMDLTANFQKLKNNVTSKKPQIVQEIVIPFENSGFALNWNPNKIGQLAVGDQKGKINILTNNQNYTAWSTLRTYHYHTSSVQDIIYSPQQDYVFASCSSDGTLQVIDMRVNQTKKSQLKINAHNKDVNVADWNQIAKHLIVTGGDDALVKVWDLRMCKKNNSEQLLCFNWHTEPITSIAFQPNQESVIAVASEDNRLSIWDMSVENQEEDPDVPNQLMFLHQGQEEIKEIKFHPVYFEMIVSSSLDSINLFKPNYEPPEQDDAEAHDKEDLQRQPIKEEDLDKLLGRMQLK